MIAEQDRSGFFGASDVSYIMGKTGSKSFRKWWLEKMGVPSNKYKSRAMFAGTYYEHRILDYIGVTSRDKQIILEDLKLRVNLDGDKEDCIYEVKTCKADKPFKMPNKYIWQVQVQMFATGIKRAKIVVYKLNENDYRNFFNEIDGERLEFFNVEYDEDFINNRFLPRLRNFADCLKRGVMPNDTM